MQHHELKQSVGVLLLDSRLRLVHYSSEAATILGYTRRPGERLQLDLVLPATRAQLGGARPESQASLEFASGRRRYRCRAFPLDSSDRSLSQLSTDVDQRRAGVVVLLERVFSQAPDLARCSEAFQLTTRECETVKLLLRGLTSKEIADQMNISPNTVKSFLKLVMAKVGATNRTGLIVKILEKAS